MFTMKHTADKSWIVLIDNSADESAPGHLLAEIHTMPTCSAINEIIEQNAAQLLAQLVCSVSETAYAFSGSSSSGDTLVAEQIWSVKGEDSEITRPMALRVAKAISAQKKLSAGASGRE